MNGRNGHWVASNGVAQHNLDNTITPAVGAINYATTLQLVAQKKQLIPRKSISYLHGEPQVIWEEDEVSQIIMNDLQYVVIGKFS